MTLNIERIELSQVGLLEKCLHYYRYIITLIVLFYRKLVGTPTFAPKSFWFKIFDLTWNYEHSEPFYMKYPFACYCLNDTEIINGLFKFHRSDSTSIFKGNTNMIRFVEIIQCMYPESNITLNDCILTCDAAYTKIYHKFLRKYLAKQILSDKKIIIETNIKKHFGNLYGQELDTDEIIDKYVCDNFMLLIFGKTYSDCNISFSNCCSKINEYLFLNRMNKISGLYSSDNHKLNLALKDFRIIIDKIIEDNKELFDQEKFTLEQRQTMVPILLFAGQETTHVLISYSIYLLSKNQEKIRDDIINNNNDMDIIIDKYFNIALADCTPAHGVARILKNDIAITNNNKVSFYRSNTVIGPMPSHLAKLDPEKSHADYNTFLPFGVGKHRCPGEQLVLMETKLLIKYLLENYQITTDADKIKFVQFFTQKIKNKYLTLFENRPQIKS
jgi:hypothetical protein